MYISAIGKGRNFKKTRQVTEIYRKHRYRYHLRQCCQIFTVRGQNSNSWCRIL